jgi:hypothetical protein
LAELEPLDLHVHPRERASVSLSAALHCLGCGPPHMIGSQRTPSLPAATLRLSNGAQRTAHKPDR